MEDKVLGIINQIRENKKLDALPGLVSSDSLRQDIGFTSFDLAELTVRIENEFNIDIFENGMVNTVGELLNKLN